MIPALIIKAAAGIIGGAVGKAVGKLIEYIPSPGESIRNNLEKLKKERDELLSKKQNTRDSARLSYIMQRIRMYENSAISKAQ